MNVNIVIYDIMGRQVNTLLNELQEPGYRSIKWSSTNAAGELVSTGVYFYMISAGQHHSVKKMLLMK